jgi:hypothetical protein
MITATELQNALAGMLMMDGAEDLFTEAISEAHRPELDMNFEPPAIIDAPTFADEGVMTTDAGLVIYTSDGSQFQLTIVRSR